MYGGWECDGGCVGEVLDGAVYDDFFEECEAVGAYCYVVAEAVHGGFFSDWSE